MAKNSVKIQQTNKGQFFITIPTSIAGLKGWKKGTELEYVEDRYGSLTLQEVKE
jgi:bifunctional DNA-binding transcriptional regulator/antitoxin component of YhaV-PrlF toxin-antitoxin module